MQPTCSIEISLPDNRARIIEALWEESGRSRLELAARLGVDKSTMSRGAAQLLECGLLREKHIKESGPKGGRRAIGLEVNPDWGAGLGLEIQPNGCCGLLADLSGNCRSTFRIDTAVSRENLVSVLEKAAAKGRESARKIGLPLVSAGLGLPGVIHPVTGVVQCSRPLGIEEPLDLSGSASDIFGMDVDIDNDVKCGCRSELAFSRQASGVSFLYLLAEERKKGLALGLGTVIRGVLFRGDNGASGELLSVYSKDFRDQLGIPSKELSEAAQNPRTMIAVSRELAPQLAFLANAFDIDTLILGGLFHDRFEELSEIFLSALRERRTYPRLVSPRVLPSKHSVFPVAYGAAVHFAENFSTRFQKLGFF